jgi:hypothetical protein
MTDHRITPPLELIKQWLAEPEYVSGWNGKCMMLSITDHRFSNICAKAAQWGADQELEACCEWTAIVGGADALRAARRPNPPSLKEQALGALGRFNTNTHTRADEMTQDFDLIRLALEALDD